MNLALVFSGQGTQHPAMLSWLGDHAVVRAMSARLGVQDWRAAAASAAWAQRNAHAQILLTGLALAAWEQLKHLLPLPVAVAGYSVGELAAFSVAGVFDPYAALDLARVRAEAMDRCAATFAGGLIAVSGLSPAAIHALCASTGLALAIRNGKQSVVLGGPLSALDMALRILPEQGARCTRLPIGVASHTPWMRAAADEFAESLSTLRWDSPRIALFSNVGERIRQAEDARLALATQIASTVRWDDCMENLHARKPDCVLEIGAGQALARIWNERYPDVPARSCDEFRSPEGVARWIGAVMRPLA